ncbi:MAG: hypothetical protein IKR54_06875 [Lachnospiraceae bacterium]|nr:hypothetical protein [Lachnospiraceae bacterium]
MSKYIALLGDGCADIAFYLGNILGALGGNVLIDDSVSVRKAEHCVGLPEGYERGTDIVRFKKVFYTQVGGIDTDDYDYVLTLYGTEVPTGKIDLAVYAFAETSEGYQKMYDNDYPEADTVCCIVRDCTGLTKKEHKAFAKKNKLGDVHFVEFNKKDIKAKLALEFLHEIRIRDLSKDMQGLVNGMVRSVKPETTSREYEKAVRATEK